MGRIGTIRSIVACQSYGIIRTVHVTTQVDNRPGIVSIDNIVDLTPQFPIVNLMTLGRSRSF
jgi:hypothetical protein